MSITDNKILSADLVNKKVIDKADDFDTDADVTKGWFDQYGDVITAKYNTLVDALDNMVSKITVPSSIAAATSNKGSYSGTVPDGSTISIEFVNGNTASSPTISIGGDSLTLSGTPRVAKLSASANQVYKFRRSGSALIFLNLPGYICEYGKSVNFLYERRSDGYAECYSTVSNSTGTLTMTEIANNICKSQKLNQALPSGLFSDDPYIVLPSIYDDSYILSISILYNECVADSVKFVVIKGGGSTYSTSYKFLVKGQWW